MSDAILAAVIGAVATVAAAVIAARSRHPHPTAPPPAEPAGKDKPEPPHPKSSHEPAPPLPPAAVASEGLGFDEVIARFESEGGVRGDSTPPGSKFYEGAKDLRFVPCRCGWGDAGYGYHEYVARGPRGAVHYIGMRLSTKSITCGPKGYHYYRDVPVCV